MSIPHSPHAHPPNRPHPHHQPHARPHWEEGESEQESQDDDDAEGEEEDGGGETSVRRSIEEEAAHRGEEDIPSPYLNTHHRAPPRITLRLNQPTKSDRKDGQYPHSRSPEPMDVDISGDSANPLISRNTSDRPDESFPAQGLQSSRRMATPPGSPLRAFIALPAPVAAPAAPAPARIPSPTRLSQQGPSARPAAYPTPASRSAVYTNGGPSTGAGPSGSDPNPPQARSLGSLWKTTPAVVPKPTGREAMTQQQEEDVEMGDEGREDEEEDELDDDAPSESVDDDKEYEPASRRRSSAAGTSRAKGANGSAASGSVAGGANGNGKPKRATRGPGKKQKAKVKEKEREKENVGVGAGSRDGRRGEEGASESAGREGKTDFAYEYVAVSQRKEGRQHIRYEMSMRQQPLQARMCNAGEKADRRPIDPPPIIQLKVIDTDGEDQAGDKARKGKRSRKDSGGMNYMHNPYYFLYATLVGSDEAQTELHVTEDGKTRFLTGTPVSSLYYLKDMNNRDAAFFVFPDLGVRKEGQYKLKLTLFEIVDQEVFYCATSFTDTFSVLSAKKFPGMQRATDLSRSFADQGLKIRVRKETKKRASGLPPRNKRRSSITEEELYHPKRPRPSLDQNYGGPHFTYDPAYPHAQVHNMPPPPVPYQSSRPIVHPPPLYEAAPHPYAPTSGPPTARGSLDYGGGPPPLAPYKPDTPLPGRSDGAAFSGHPGRAHNHAPMPSPSSSAHPSAAMPPSREAAYFQDERERQRHHEIQMAQRREIDARRQAEHAKAVEADRGRLYQQNRQQAQQQQRLAQLAQEQAAYEAQHGGAAYPMPMHSERVSYPPPAPAPEHQTPAYRPAGPAPGPSDFELHEREKRKGWKAKKQDREARHREEYGPPEGQGDRPAGYDQHGRPHPPQQDARGPGHHPQYPPYPPSGPSEQTYYGQYPPQPSSHWDPRERMPSGGVAEERRDSRGNDSARSGHSTPATGRDHRLPSAHYSDPSSAHRPASTPQHQSSAPSFDSSGHAHSASTANSARSTPQPVRTPQDTSSYHPLPSRSVSHSQLPGKPISANHYEPTPRSSLTRLRPDDWADSPRSLSFGSGGGGDRDREADRGGLTLPSIATLTTPGQSRQGTPGTPASMGTTVTPGRDHRLGLGHLVD